MPRQDIITALKNAMERGYSLDLAVHSLVNAGYKLSEVEEAAVSLSGGGIPVPATSMQKQAILQSRPQISQMPQPRIPMLQTQQAQAQQPAGMGKKRKIKIIILVVILAILIGVLIKMLIPLK